MKKLAVLIAIITIFASCETRVKYPRYSLVRISCVPDSLKEKHRDWIKETIRASNQHLTAGDYEDIDETIQQVERTASSLFEVSVMGLKKEVDSEVYNDITLMPNELTPYERTVLDSLVNSH